MNLSILPIKQEYRSDTDNLVNSFYNPCLSNSVVYKRSVGYFTSKSLAVISKGVIELVNNGGKMQLIASPQLEEEDVQAIETGYKARDEIITRALLRQLDNVEEMIIKQRLGFLAMLIAEGRLDFKIAVLKDLTQKGIYHEKIGVFEDCSGNTVTFSGSANETEGGLFRNFEQIDAFCSWKLEDKSRVIKKQSNFNELWENSTEGLDIISFTNAIKEGLIRFRDYAPLSDPESNDESRKKLKNFMGEIDKKPDIPGSIKLREYQKEAIKSWFYNEGKGIYEMATGTGKTITALATGVTLYKKIKEVAIIVVCPYTHLVEQWAKEATLFNLNPIVAYETSALWENELNRQILSYNIGNTSSFCVVTTNRTFISPLFQKSLKKIRKNSMLIVDEAHHIGAKESLRNLPDHISYRLALSATPYRWMDPEGTQQIIEYFSPGVIFRFGLKEAIGPFLTEYYYYPHIVELVEDEMNEYHDLSRKIAKLSNFGNKSVEIDHNTEQVLQSLLIRRAKLIGRAQNKTTLLYNLMKSRTDSKFNIFYCSEQKIDEVRQVEEVMMMLGHQLNMRIHPFTAEESNEERKKILKDFEKGKLQGLVAIRCLDEGVDIPATETAYILASSTNPREFIQRRGRVLRKHPNKKYSYIHDFIVIPNNIEQIKYSEPNIFNTERSLIKKELIRAKEFSDLARNGPEARNLLLDVRKKYNLLDI
ncbi:DEAD/DEAH box helicase family protein [Priestia megaterium]